MCIFVCVLTPTKCVELRMCYAKIKVLNPFFNRTWNFFSKKIVGNTFVIASIHVRDLISSALILTLIKSHDIISRLQYHESIEKKLCKKTLVGVRQKNLVLAFKVFKIKSKNISNT